MKAFQKLCETDPQKTVIVNQIMIDIISVEPVKNAPTFDSDTTELTKMELTVSLHDIGQIL